MKQLIVLEGLPGAGKTSLLALLGQDESVEMVPQILPDNPLGDHHLTKEDIFKSELLKTQRFKESPNKVVVFDRHYASLLAYHWSQDVVYGGKTYPEVLAWYEDKIKNGQLLRPSITFYIKTPLETSFKRKGRSPDPQSKDQWLNPNFLREFSQYYDSLYSQIEPEALVVSLNGEDTLESLNKQIKDTISTRLKGIYE